MDYGPLFHLSFDGSQQGLWVPRNPGDVEGVEEMENTAADSVYSEPAIDRISFSPTILNCLQAIYPNIGFLFEEKRYPHIDMYVYSPELKGSEKIITPEQLTQRRMVWDAFITKEHWSLDPVEMRLVGRVRIDSPGTNPKSLTVRPFDDRREPKRSYITPVAIKFKWISINNPELVTMESPRLSIDW